MHRATTAWGRRGRVAFAEVPQADDGEEDRQFHEKRTPDQFCQQVPPVFQRGSIEVGLETKSLHSSPALSDTALLSGDYLEVYGNEYNERDIGDFAEYNKYYGPQPVDASPTKSLKAGLGIEVCHEPQVPNVTVNELFLDHPLDHPLVDNSYKGSEGSIEQQDSNQLHNYKPLILRRRSLVLLFAALVVLLALTEVIVHLLPDASTKLQHADDHSSTEARLRSRSSDKMLGYDSGLAFPPPQEDEEGPGDRSSAISSPTTELEATSSSVDDDSGAPSVIILPIQGTTSTPVAEQSSTDKSDIVTLPYVTTTDISSTVIPTTTKTSIATEVPKESENPSSNLPGTSTTRVVTPKPPLSTETTTIEPPESPLSTTQTTIPDKIHTKTSHDESTTTSTSTVRIPDSVPIKSSMQTTATSPDQAPTTTKEKAHTTSQPLHISDLITIPEGTTNLVPTGGTGTTTEDNPGSKPPVETHTSRPTEKPHEPTNPIETTPAPDSPDGFSILPVDMTTPVDIPTTINKPPTSHTSIIDIPATSGILSMLPIDTDRISILPIDTHEISILPIATQKPPPDQNPPKTTNTLPTTHLDTYSPPTDLATEPPSSKPTKVLHSSTDGRTEKPMETKLPPAQHTETPNAPQPTKGHPAEGNAAQGYTDQGNVDQGHTDQEHPAEGNAAEGHPAQGNPTEGQASHDSLIQVQLTTSVPSNAQATTNMPMSPSSGKEAIDSFPRPTATLLLNDQSLTPISSSLPLENSPPGEDIGPSVQTHPSSNVIIKPSSITSFVPPMSEPDPAQNQDSKASSTSTDDPYQDIFANLVPFTTLTITGKPSPTKEPQATTTGPSTLGDDDSDSYMDGVGPVQKYLETALTFYTPPPTDGRTIKPYWAYKSVGPQVQTDTNGRPNATNTIAVLYASQETIMTDHLGRPTGTLTYYAVPYATTLFDNHGRATVTRTSFALEVPVTRILRDKNGNPTATTTVFEPIPSSTSVHVVTATPTATANPNNAGPIRVSDAQYFGVLILPTLLAIMLAIPFRILDRTARLYQPFHAMTSEVGAPASESLCLKTRGPRAFFVGSLRSALGGRVLLSLTGALVLASAVLIPLSGEAAHLMLRSRGTGTDCLVGEDGVPEDCTIAAVALPNTARAVFVVLALMLLLLGATTTVLWPRRWRTGVVASPWSLLYAAHLATNPDIQILLHRVRERHGPATTERVDREFGRRAFMLHYWSDNAALKYSILISNGAREYRQQRRQPWQWQQLLGKKREAKPGIVRDFHRKRARRAGNSGTMPFFLLTFAGRMVFLSFLSAVLALVIVCHITGKEGRLGMIMIGQSSGIRILFTTLGVLVTFAWESLFDAVAFLRPFRLLDRKDSPYRKEADAMTPPTNVFSGTWSALARRPRDPYLGAVAVAGLLVELLPLLLSNVPLEARGGSGPGIGLAAAVCTWIAVVVLGAALLVLAASFLVRWPNMPVDPTTFAGTMYYASDPTASSSVTGMSPTAGMLFARVLNGSSHT